METVSDQKNVDLDEEHEELHLNALNTKLKQRRLVFYLSSKRLVAQLRRKFPPSEGFLADYFTPFMAEVVRMAMLQCGESVAVITAVARAAAHDAHDAHGAGQGETSGGRYGAAIEDAELAFRRIRGAEEALLRLEQL